MIKGTTHLLGYKILEPELIHKLNVLVHKKSTLEKDFNEIKFNTELIESIEEEIHVLTFDDFSIIAYRIPDDEYRNSCGTYIVPRLDLGMFNKEIEVDYDIDLSKYSFDTTVKITKDNNPVFESYTDNSDEYYPVGIIHYNPENLK